MTATSLPSGTQEGIGSSERPTQVRLPGYRNSDGDGVAVVAALPFRLLTPDQAAEVLAISRSKLYEMMAAGDIQSIPIGRSRRIPLHCIEEFVENRLAQVQDS